MNDEKWGNLKETLVEKFPDLKETKEDASSEDDLGNKIEGVKEILEFMSPDLGELRIERLTRPRIIDKKSHYSRTAMGKAQVEYVLDPEEKTHKITVYKKDEFSNDWQPMELPTERLSF